jgi:hypothetical protein
MSRIAGGLEAGADAGVDGGLDAGADAGTGCRGPGDCALTDWCDDGVCRRQCATSGDCTNGRRCDTRTGVCVRPCTLGCGPAEVCDTTTDAGTGVCVRACDATLLCPLGSRCLPSNVCGPESLVTADCVSPFATCQAGECVFDGTCALDTDCPLDEMCVLGQCRPRPTGRVDAGADAGLTPFACNAACDCRLGEVCLGGRCQPDVRPTWYLTADGGGDGRAPGAASSSLSALVADAGRGAVVALRAGDTFHVDAGLALAAGVELSGGWRACGPTRWVRDVAASTSVVRTSAGPVVSVPGTTAALRPDVRVSGLDVFAPTPPCTAGLLDVRGAPRVRLERVSGAFPAFDCAAAGGQGNGGDLVRLVSSDDVRLQDVRLRASGNTQGTLSIVWATASDGRFERLELDPQGTHAAIRAVRLQNNARPVVVDGLALGDRTAVTADVALDLSGGAVVTARNLSVPFGRKADTQLAGNALVKAVLTPLVLESSAVGLAGFSGQTFSSLVAVDQQDAPLTVRDVGIVLPQASGDDVIGVRSVRGPLVVERVQVRGGGTQFRLTGVRLEGVSSGTNRVVDSVVELVGSPGVALGVSTYQVPATAGLTVLRSTLDARTTSLITVILDGGTSDAQGNRFVPNAVCLERPGPSPVLAAGSPCLDQGRYSLRSTAQPVLTDLEGKPRDAGLGPDLGCYERP